MPSFDEFFWPEDYLVDPQQYLFCATFHCYFFVCRVGNTDQIMTLFIKSEANRRVFTQVPFGVKYKRFKKIAWIQSHHLHLQWKFKLLAGKFSWGNKAQHCWVMSTIFFFQKFLDNTKQCFAFTTRVNFPANNLNFHWRWRW